jgi:hypothetical protein
LPDRIDPAAPSIAVVGDLQITPTLVRRMRGREDNRVAQRRLLDDLSARADNLGALIIVGDLVFSARSPRAWRHFDGLIGPLADTLTVLPAIGNHDYHCALVQFCWQNVVPKRFRARFPWMSPGTPYAVSYRNIALIVLDSETALAGQSEWLAEQLVAIAPTHALALIFFHRPPYSNSIDVGAHGDEDVQRYFVPVLQSAPLPSVVFNGHVHGYEHLSVDSVHYFTTAGGGGPRGQLGADRPRDVYPGRNCAVDRDGAVRRPFNYALITPAVDTVRIDVRGFCKNDSTVELIESVQIPLATPGQ